MKLDVIAKDLDFAGVAGFGQMVDGVIPAGRFVLRPVRKSDAGLFAMYAGDRRVAEATRSIPHPLPPVKHQQRRYRRQKPVQPPTLMPNLRHSR